jgi:hypothetical protein
MFIMKKQYHTPQLNSLGDVESITQSQFEILGMSQFDVSAPMYGLFASFSGLMYVLVIFTQGASLCC